MSVMECKQSSFSAVERKTLLNTEKEEKTALPVRQLCRLIPDDQGQHSTGTGCMYRREYV